jgi:hypothetical protein
VKTSPCEYRPYSCEEIERTKSLTMDQRHYPQYNQEKGLSPTKTKGLSDLREKFKAMCAEVKRILRESREKFFRNSSLESDIKHNPKRFWSLLQHTSKSRSIHDLISRAAAPGAATNPLTPHQRTRADSPAGIANLFTPTLRR